MRLNKDRKNYTKLNIIGALLIGLVIGEVIISEVVNNLPIIYKKVVFIISAILLIIGILLYYTKK